MTSVAVRRNVRRQARQIWDHIESQFDLEKGVSPGVIFPKLPKDARRVKPVEQLFNEEGIAVVWENETATKTEVEKGGKIGKTFRTRSVQIEPSLPAR
jgi:hypothetical protein